MVRVDGIKKRHEMVKSAKNKHYLQKTLGEWQLVTEALKNVSYFIPYLPQKGA